MTDVEVRANWFEALRKVEKGTELCPIISCGLSDQDLIVLGAIHESINFREKIEDLLEYCNFNVERAWLSEGKYDKLREMIIHEYW